MAAFALSGRTGPGSAARPLLKGMILAAGIGALLIGLALLPLSSLAFALGSGLGLLGLAPLLTAHRLWRRARRMEGTGSRGGLKWAGALLVAVLPALAMASEVWGDRTRLADLRSKDRPRVLRALSPDAVYGPGDLIRDPALLRNLICDERNSLPMDDPEVEAAVHRGLGVRDEHGINDRCDWRRRL